MKNLMQLTLCSSVLKHVVFYKQLCILLFYYIMNYSRPPEVNLCFIKLYAGINLLNLTSNRAQIQTPFPNPTLPPGGSGGMRYDLVPSTTKKISSMTKIFERLDTDSVSAQVNVLRRFSCSAYLLSMSFLTPTSDHTQSTQGHTVVMVSISVGPNYSNIRIVGTE